MKTWVTSDLHFGHKNVIIYDQRPFKDVHEMNKALTENWNALVAPEDLVIIVGDVSLERDEKTWRSYLEKLNGIKILVQGNHDKEKAIPKDLFLMIVQHMQIKVRGGILVNISHYPYKNDAAELKEAKEGGYEPKFQDLRLEDRGQWLIHGHVHTSWKFRKKMINVGTCVWDYKPVLLDDLIDIISPVNPPSEKA